MLYFNWARWKERRKEGTKEPLPYLQQCLSGRAGGGNSFLFHQATDYTHLKRTFVKGSSEPAPTFYEEQYSSTKNSLKLGFSNFREGLWKFYFMSKEITYYKCGTGIQWQNLTPCHGHSGRKYGATDEFKKCYKLVLQVACSAVWSSQTYTVQVHFDIHISGFYFIRSTILGLRGVVVSRYDSGSGGSGSIPSTIISTHHRPLTSRKCCI
jgi:hypothetical protein